MQEKKRQEKTAPLPELKSTVTEILVANGRSFQPFIRTFNYTGENISKSNLGSLIGIFEIDETSEDCAYIVNFLASVAKKEYWSNPRRGAIESFEAALHKINLALSELVKHGNVAWLGKLHGTLAILEKNNFHFSVTGQAKILLLRNGSLSDISDGLSSEESRLHPIKTFVEVSSGRLTLDDRIILTSPDLLALFSLDDLIKNARRMDSGQFLQFLKTVLVNEFDMAGTLLIEVEEKIMIPLPKTSKQPTEEKSLERVQNIFSQSAFLSKKPREALVSGSQAHPDKQTSSEVREEYTDTKTGHIYVQGTLTEERKQHQNIERFKLKFEELYDTVHSLLLSQVRWIRKGKKQLSIGAEIFKEQGRVLNRRSGRLFRRLWRKQQAFLRKSFIKKEVVRETTPLLETMRESILHESTARKQTVKTSVIEPENHSPFPPFIREKVASFYQRESKLSIRESAPVSEKNALSFAKNFLLRSGTFLRKYSSQCLTWPTKLKQPLIEACRKPRSFLKWAITFFQRYPRKSLVVIGAFTGLMALSFVVSQSKMIALVTPATEENETTTPDRTISQSQNTPSLNMMLAFESTQPIITSVVLNDQAYIVTENTLISVTDRKSFSLPSGNKARFATAMDDLRLIFVYTENGKLYAFSPISKTFVENTLSLPAGATITGIDTYLTYLYVLESSHDQVYRFPRADGGFGTGTPWLKELVTIDTSAHLAVNESLFITTDNSTIKGFFRGRITSTFETPNEFRLTSLYAHPELENVYALDAEYGRIVIWNQDGHLIKELSHDMFTNGHTLSVNGKTGELLVSTDHSLLSFKLK